MSWHPVGASDISENDRTMSDGRQQSESLANGEFHDVPALTNVLPGWTGRAALNVQPWLCNLGMLAPS